MALLRQRVYQTQRLDDKTLQSAYVVPNLNHLAVSSLAVNCRYFLDIHELFMTMYQIPICITIPTV